MGVNMNQETLEKMTSLRLREMFNAFKTSLETSQRESMTIDQFISLLIISEWDDRRNRASIELSSRLTSATKLLLKT